MTNRTNTRTVRDLLTRLEAVAACDQPTAYLRAELSDYGINTLRDHAADAGWSRTDLGRMLGEELARCRRAGCTPDEAGLKLYFRAKRAGSGFFLTRALRAAVFAQLVGRGAL